MSSSRTSTLFKGLIRAYFWGDPLTCGANRWIVNISGNSQPLPLFHSVFLVLFVAMIFWYFLNISSSAMLSTWMRRDWKEPVIAFDAYYGQRSITWMSLLEHEVFNSNFKIKMKLKPNQLKRFLNHEKQNKNSIRYFFLNKIKLNAN
jgi:hypothetical protein